MAILVLNADFQPLNVTTLKRGFNLVWNGRAEIIKYDSDSPILSATTAHKRPLIIRLIRYVSIPFKKVPLTRHNVYRRDGHQCGYCESKKDLTLDHIIPKCKGGGNTWDNLVTCCKKCNNKKDNKSPKDAGMKLLVKVYKPTYIEFIRGINGDKREEWTEYIN